MHESKLHKIVKNGVAQALLQDGFNVQTEYTSELEDEGRIDVYASKPDGELVKVEVVNTHVPDWLLIKLGNNITRSKQMRTIAVSTENYNFLNSLKTGTESFDDVITRIVPLIKSAKVQKTETT